MPPKPLKRFYTAAEAAAIADGFAIRLDGKPVKTPGGRRLTLPTHALAAAVAAEWEAQAGTIAPSTMPLTQLASTALDRVGPERPHITAELLNYAGTDLLCYRAETPADLVARQTAGWQPLLDWAALALDAPLLITTSLLAVEQPRPALAALERAVDRLDPWRLTAVQSATVAAGSLVLALALAAGRLDAAQTFELSQLDETYQIELWGEDWEAADRRAALKADIAAAERLLALTAKVD